MVPGEHILKMVITYDLDTGERITLVEEATVLIRDGWGGDDMYGMGGTSGGGMSSGGMSSGGMVSSVRGDVVMIDGGGGMVFSSGPMAASGRGGSGGNYGFGDDSGPSQASRDGFMGFVDTLVGWTQSGFNYSNQYIWPWIVAGGLVGLCITLPVVRSVKMRKAYSLED
jgi:hypothetical protein